MLDLSIVPESIRSEVHILILSLAAVTLGGLVGWERESAGKWAGLRTHMLVCLATMLFVRVTLILTDFADENIATDALRADPLRVIEAIVTGIAFLGAGTIFRDPDHIRAKGLTTAASLLAIAPIGIALALEKYVLAIGATLITLFVLRVLGYVDHPAQKEPEERPD